ncbi:hypothetical protein Tco_1384472 [Tanacetum coccineum]
MINDGRVGVIVDAIVSGQIAGGEYSNKEVIAAAMSGTGANATYMEIPGIDKIDEAVEAEGGDNDDRIADALAAAGSAQLVQLVQWFLHPIYFQRVASWFQLLMEYVDDTKNYNKWLLKCYISCDVCHLCSYNQSLRSRSSSSKMANNVQEIIEQVLTVAKAVEDKLDDEIAALEKLDVNDIEVLRERRLQQMKKMAEKRTKWVALGHGEYTEIFSEKDFLLLTKPVIALFVIFIARIGPARLLTILLF